MKRLILSIFLLLTLGFAFASTDMLASSQRVITTRCDHGDINPYHPLGEEYVVGQVFILTIMPDEGYEIEYIYVNGIPQPIPSPNPNGTFTFELTIPSLGDEELIIDVCFNTTDVQYKITATCGPGGTIAHQPGQGVAVVGDPTSRWYLENSTPTYTITPDDEYIIDDVTVDGMPVTLTGNDYTFAPLVNNSTIHATFKLAPVFYDLEITHKFLDENGEEVLVGDANTNPTEGTHTYLENTNLTVDFILGSKWLVYEVIYDGVPMVFNWTIESERPTNYPVIMDSDHTLEVTFRDDPVGISTIEIPSLSISPNPVSGIATITKDADVIFTHIDVVDIMGNVIMNIENPTETIDFSALATGNYIVRFHTAKGFAVIKVGKN